MSINEDAALLSKTADEMRRTLMVGIGSAATKDELAQVAMLVGQLATIVRALAEKTENKPS